MIKLYCRNCGAKFVCSKENVDTIKSNKTKITCSICSNELDFFKDSTFIAPYIAEPDIFENTDQITKGCYILAGINVICALLLASQNDNPLFFVIAELIISFFIVCLGRIIDHLYQIKNILLKEKEKEK